MPTPFDDTLIMPGPEARARAVQAVADYNAARPSSQMAVYRNIGLILVPAALLYGWIAWLLLKTGSKNSPETFILAGMFMAAHVGRAKALGLGLGTGHQLAAERARPAHAVRVRLR